MKKINIYLWLIYIPLLLSNCADPIKIRLDQTNYCITDQNGGIIRQVIISKLDTLGHLKCERIISKTPKEKGSSTVCLFEQNKGYNKFKECLMESGYIYKIYARNQGFADSLIFKID